MQVPHRQMAQKEVAAGRRAVVAPRLMELNLHCILVHGYPE